MLSATLLFLLAGSAFAADKKESEVVNKSDFSVTSVASLGINYAAMQEENVKLKIQGAELADQLDNLQNKLDYSQMMYATMNHLWDAAFKTAVEDAKNQLDYARMMNVTLLNLSSLKN